MDSHNISLMNESWIYNEWYADVQLMMNRSINGKDTSHNRTLKQVHVGTVPYVLLWGINVFGSKQAEPAECTVLYYTLFINIIVLFALYYTV